MDNKKLFMKENTKRLFSNTIFLYMLTFSSQFFNFLTVPYLTRILSPTIYGKIGIALAYMAYIQIILDFGFILSATQKVVENRENNKILSKILSAVTGVKLFLSLIIIIIFSSYVLLNNKMKDDILFYLLYMFSTIINALMPDFFYRGMEKMKIITIRTVIIKALATLGTFLFVKEAIDYWLIPFFMLLGNIIAVFIMYYDIKKVYYVTFRYVEIAFVKKLLKDTTLFFISRIASTTYQIINTIILNIIYGSSSMIGYYTSADKIISLGKTVSGPIADSLYPYMIKQKNFSLIKKLLLLFMPIIIIVIGIIYWFADYICIWIFGIEYIETGKILKCLLPILIVILPTYILCFPVMVPMGLSKWANISNLVGMCSQILGLFFLIFNNKLNIYTLCILSSVTEIIVFIFRLTVVYFYKYFRSR